MDLHGQIMNILADANKAGTDDARLAYLHGHRDARHAAAEMALKADAQIDALAEVVVDVLAGVPDHDIEGMTGYGKHDCDRISNVKAWALAHQRARAVLVYG